MGVGLSSSNLLNLTLSSGPISKAVLLILLLISIASWAVIFYKWRMFRRMLAENRRFMIFFRTGEDLAVIRRKAEIHSESPLARVFIDVYGMLQPHLEGTEERDLSLRSVQSWLRTAVEKETIYLEEYLPFLATTGNVAPFIGLFGTVLGVMNSFHAIGAMGTANIAAVAPGVAEALVATAAGLFAAIPAVMAYNYYLNRVRIMANEMESFSAEVINRVESHMFRTSVEV